MSWIKFISSHAFACYKIGKPGAIKPPEETVTISSERHIEDVARALLQYSGLADTGGPHPAVVPHLPKISPEEVAVTKPGMFMGTAGWIAKVTGQPGHYRIDRLDSFLDDRTLEGFNPEDYLGQ